MTSNDQLLNPGLPAENGTNEKAIALAFSSFKKGENDINRFPGVKTGKEKHFVFSLLYFYFLTDDSLKNKLLRFYFSKYCPRSGDRAGNKQGLCSQGAYIWKRNRTKLNQNK